jgi:L-lactate dehydrogenase
MKHSKIAIIGAGRVGTTTAYALMLNNVASEIILVDCDQNRCAGEILDLADVLAFSATSTISVGSYQEAAQADIIIITAGIAQKPGQSRAELVKTNAATVKSIIENMLPINPQAIILMVTNPVDLMALQAYKYAKLPANQIIGSGTLLDSKRLQGLVARTLGIAEESVEVYTLGEHGDTQFPVWSSAQVSGVPLSHWPEITPELQQTLATKARERVYDIIACKGSTYYGIASSAAFICQTILFDQKRVLPLSVYDKKQDMYYSLPAVLGSQGIERIVDVELNEQEQKQLESSCDALIACRTELS